MSLSKLEDLIMCPIHLGMMEDPRILPCGHAFCLNCLFSCLVRMSLSLHFGCPVCRRVCDLDQRTVHLLPPSIATKQLTDYIVETKSKIFMKQHPNMEYISNESIKESLATSVEQKRELVKHLIRDISEYKKNTKSGLDHYGQQFNDILKSMETPMSMTHPLSESENAVVHSNNSNNSNNNNMEVFNSNYELMDVETIRENMKKYSEYKLLRDVNHSLTNYYSGRNKMIIADIKMCNHEPEVIVWSCPQSNVIIVKTADLVLHEFTIRIDSFELHPIYMKIFNNHLFLTGTIGIGKTREKRYHFVQCSFLGEIIHISTFNSTHELTTPMAGFHIDPRSGKILLALPESCKIAILSNTLVETSHGYHFNDLHPSFVTQNNDTAEIWASCPQDGRIIIIDEETGSYRQLGTDQIYNAIPSHITISGDNRVMFLDCHQNRVFWVRKRNDFILIQRITFIGHHNKQLNGNITAMVSVTGMDSLGRLLFSIGDNACLVRPAKTIGGQNHKHLMCNIL